MIKHIVMWSLKDEAMGRKAADNAAEMKKRLEGLQGKVPGLLHIEVGTEVFAATNGCQVILYSEFPDREALDGYQKHPAHLACVEFVVQVVAGRNVVDYEI